MKKYVILLAVLGVALGAERRAVVPAGAPAPVGPYTPGILAGDYLYVSGQGALDSAGKMPDTIEQQTRVTLQNVKDIVEAAGLTMGHVVYTQCFLEDMANRDAFERIWREFFPGDPPASVLVGVAKMPVNTPVEVNAVAVRDLAHKKPAPGGVLTQDRFYVSGVYEAAELQKALRGAGVKQPAFTNVYRTTPAAARPARTGVLADIQVAALPGGAAVAFSGVAPREAQVRTKGPCAFAGDTAWCTAYAAAGAGLEEQVHETLRRLGEALKAGGFTLANVTATNVYLDDIGEFSKMNAVYREYFPEMPPTRTTVQPAPTGVSRKLVEISVTAVR